MKNIRFTNSLTRPLLAERPVTMWVPQGYICIYDIVLCCPYWVIMHLDENKWYVLFWALCWDLSLFMIYPLCGWRDSAWQKCGYYLTKTAIKMLFWTGAANNNMLLYSEKIINKVNWDGKQTRTGFRYWPHLLWMLPNKSY